ncbi:MULTISPECIES: SH3 domain-containing protein [Paraclostridium]|uniref:SH3 domain-containing protein n=1 Tax=Paraclostridium bifermentans TaxID=1490 RepID=A0A5P3XAL8_PARBF|nr:MULTISPECIES: SH3 domain-containing protein [Paraclostridium]MCU9808970.1 SH3 domain-containing protein [Paraclostridium sp. AKS46]MBN8046602.1 SH3 domain-containing protein [Paraclostridium bifermentans]MBZ6004856.1 SH3 domain-containing protein [Paraclostridium bifermentans]MDU0295628.1 SH3 domain-containing protein [Paraclostridium sp. MRS3W1]NME09329.1 SH3 domain-containing protein [Paraclostridium bifermentans]
MSMNKRARKSSLILALGLVVGGLYTSTSNIYAAEREVVKAEKLNVRKGPSIEEQRVGSLDRGMVVEILETNNGWNKIKLTDGNEGWVSGDYTDKENGTVTASKLNVRKGPATEHDKLDTLDKNTEIKLLEEQDNWYRIKLDDKKEGWVCGDYVLTESQAKEQEQNQAKQQANDTIKEVKSASTVSDATTNESSNSQAEASSNNNNGTSMSIEATAYAGDTITSTGTTPKWGTIAVDPTVIPYGTKVYIPKFDMVFTAEDCGSAIKGKRIDIFMNSEAECVKFGRQNMEIKILK